MREGKRRLILHVGLDDIDSQFSGCTTHFAYVLVKELVKFVDVEFVDYPNLVRLNPSIPFRTRGNGAVVLRISALDNEEEFITNLIRMLLDDYVSNYEVRSGCEPGLAIVVDEIPEAFNRLYVKALTDFVHVDYVKKVVSQVSNLRLPLGMSRGVIGALAAIGWIQGSDCTYELVAYRSSVGSDDRCVDSDSVRKAELKYGDYVFNNYDYEDDVVLITPHGSNPVLLGIRGEDPDVLVKYFNELSICEAYSGYMIFRTNQGTDAHLINRKLDEVRTYRTLCIETSVKSKPINLRGGDILIKISDEPPIYSAFYKETSLSGVASELNEGDEVIICGSVKMWSNFTNVVNVEKVFIKKRVHTYVRNPKCPNCGKRMKSAGTNKGFKCESCGFKSRDLNKEIIKNVENINKLYVTRTRALKHLTKPLCRYGKEKQCSFTKPAGRWVL